jgi:lipopolysaccharide biosynthesis glycosyltransferase
MSLIPLVVGFDQKEAIAYHVFCQSVLDKSTQPVSFIPLAKNTLNKYYETHKDGSNEFIYSRFLTPYLLGYSGWAIYADGDMVCLEDISKLWNVRVEHKEKAVLVVQHDYKTKAAIKYLGNKNENYPRKNWSSLVLWNCEHPKNKILTPEFIQKSTGSFLHRFSWLEESEIGELKKEWNWLALEYPDNREAKLIHYTLGTPCFKDYSEGAMSVIWFEAFRRASSGMEY